MSENDRSIELEVVVDGTPGEVWQAIATGPGISSWYVPHVVEEREGGEALASFGDAPEMQIPGRVAAWDPPRRIVFDGGEDVEGLTFEWLVDAGDAGTCTVRLVNGGFGSGTEWDAQYDAMTEGWQLFLFNLQLHCHHFRGQQAVSMLPTTVAALSRSETWARLCADLGIPASLEVGDLVEVSADDELGLAGTVVGVDASSLALLLDRPLHGTAFVAVEQGGEGCPTSIWAYLYGPDATGIVQRDKPRWQAWLDAFSAV